MNQFELAVTVRTQISLLNCTLFLGGKLVEYFTQSDPNKDAIMDRLQQALSKNDKEFKELFGVKKEIFHQMHTVITVACQQRHSKGGRPPKLSTADQLLMTLQYWREYRTMAHLAFDFSMAKSTVCDTITMVENVLISDGSFHLPGKKALLSPENAGRTFAVDATESPVERPKKNKKSGTPVRKSGIQSRRKSLPT